MANREDLRRLNQLQNQSKPPQKETTKGTTKGRDRQTGKAEVELYNGGKFFGDKLFNSSPSSSQPVQVNLNTKTADYKKTTSTRAYSDDLLFLEEKNKGGGTGSGFGSRPTTSEENIPNQDNGAFGNCPACGGNSGGAGGGGSVLASATCASGYTQLTFSDGTSRQVKGTVSLSYGVRASYTGVNGVSGEINPGSCAQSSQSSEPEGGGVALTVGDETVNNVDPESISYQCVLTVSRVCDPYVVSWKNKSGEDQSYQSCDPIGYKVVSQDKAEFQIGSQVDGYTLKYDSGIPRSFCVGNYCSGNAGYFQIYQSKENSCEYIVVGWTDVSVGTIYAELEDGTIVDETIVNGNYTIVYSGGCGFEITLGGYLVTEVLEIYGANCGRVQRIEDYLSGSASGPQYTGCVDGAAQFNGNTQAGEITEVPEFEKTNDASDENPITIVDVQCI